MTRPLNQAFKLSPAYYPCDVRGAVGSEVNPEDAFRIGRALGYLLDEKGWTKSVVVGGDVRLSTRELKQTLVEGLIDAGCQVIDIGIVPTPVFYFAKEKLGAVGGIMVTASHNPPHHNGFKPIIGNLPNTEAELKQLWAEVAAGHPGHGGGSVSKVEIIDEYVGAIKRLLTADGRIRVVVDSGNGCCGTVAPNLFRDLGYDVVELFSEPDGRFPNRGPDSAQPRNLLALGRRVLQEGADLGVAYDGDGDRVAFVDEKGEPLDSDRTFMLFVRDRLSIEKGPVVYDLKCSSAVPEHVEALGGTPIMEKTGHIFVKRRFLIEQALLSGEMTGHYAFKEIGRDDGMYASLRMAHFLQGLGEPLSRAAAELPRYWITPDVRLQRSQTEISELLTKLKAKFADQGKVTELDGVRVEFAEGWGLARASVTAPEITFRFEGRTRSGLEAIIQRFVDAEPALAGDLRPLLEMSERGG